MPERPKRENIMLAYPSNPGRIQRLGAVFALQPKYKGERCRIEWFHNKPVAISSYGNEFKFMEHITNAVELFKDFPFDGELYKHTWPQGRINSAASTTRLKRNPDTISLSYYIYDLQLPSIPQSKRLQALKALKQHFPKNENFSLKISPSWEVTKDTWLPHAANLIENNYEGAIFRGLKGLYTNKRSTSLLKFKPTEIDTYRITKVIEAISTIGERKGIVGSFLVKAEDEDISFKVGAGKLTHKERKKIWENKDSVIVKYLEVKQELTRTEKGIPECATAIRVI